jgi:hypothetical protein
MPKVAVTFACGLYDRKGTLLLLGKRGFSGRIATRLPPEDLVNDVSAATHTMRAI